MTGPLRDALEEVYRLHRQALFTCALQVTGRPERAEDAVHDAFVRLFALAKLPRRLKPYVFRAVRNAAIDLVRARPAEPVPLDGAAGVYRTEAMGPGERAEAAESARRAVEALERLGDPEREVIVLHLAAGLTFREIARVLDRPAGSVASWYRRGLERLRRRCKEREEG